MTEAVVRLECVSKLFGAARAVDGVSMEVPRGQVFTLLGPSGCGKTTTLRMVAGLERPTEGRIVFGDTVVNDAERKTFIPPHKRNVGMVFQSYAIWPHMTVFDNVAYPLRLRGLPKEDIQQKVERVLTLVGMQEYALRPAPDLSGGQQQRVALSRALVYEPDLLLLDEPFSNLDARLRGQMRLEVRLLQQRLGITVLFVTHDQLEALSMSDQIAILNQGHLEQVGVPSDLYDRPASPFVRDFLGQTIRLPGNVWIRPEDLQVAHRNGMPPCQANAVDGVIDALLFVGDHYEAQITLSNGQPLLVPLARAGGWSPGEPVVLTWSNDRAQIWPE
ncbi:MAG TPA: ABC transporter ATP-binding protein [Chloroflexota bacterium]